MKKLVIVLLIFSIKEKADCQVFGNMIERNIQSTVLISIGQGSGSGILVTDSISIMSLVTAKHVLFDPKSNFSKLNAPQILIQFYAHNFKNDSANYILLDLIKLQKGKLLKVDSLHDICIVTIAHIKESGAIDYKDGVIRLGYSANYFTFPIYEDGIMRKKDLFLGENIFIIGFPSSIGLKQMPQFDYSKPLLKRGAIAGISNEFDNIVVDCPVYHGNSGGPVFLERKGFEKYSLRLIGIVSQYIPLYNPTVSKKDLTEQTSSYAVIVPIEYALDLIYEK